MLRSQEGHFSNFSVIGKKYRALKIKIAVEIAILRNTESHKH